MVRYAIRLSAVITAAVVALSGLAGPASAGYAAAQIPGPAVNATGLVSSWPSGPIAPGGSKTWHWNNANPLTLSYEVGLVPAGVNSGAPCIFEVTRSWYVQRWGGEREFWFTVTNIGIIACATEVVLTSIDPLTSWSTGGINPGASRTWHWNNANPLNSSFSVGLSPLGSTSTDLCQFEIIRTWYEQQPSGEREFWFTAKNVGAITCMADIRLAQVAGSTGPPAPLAMGVGAVLTATLVPLSPPIRAFLPGMQPQNATGSSPCRIEILRHWYERQFNGPSSVGLLRMQYKNIGDINCAARPLFTVLA